jgi:hypothetical protein
LIDAFAPSSIGPLANPPCKPGSLFKLVPLVIASGAFGIAVIAGGGGVVVQNRQAGDTRGSLLELLGPLLSFLYVACSVLDPILTLARMVISSSAKKDII